MNYNNIYSSPLSSGIFFFWQELSSHLENINLIGYSLGIYSILPKEIGVYSSYYGLVVVIFQVICVHVSEGV
jgi:hypothetical protein